MTIPMARDALKKIACLDELVKETAPFLANEEYSSYHLLRSDIVMPGKYPEPVWCFYAVENVGKIRKILNYDIKAKTKREDIAGKMVELITLDKGIKNLYSINATEIRKNADPTMWNIYEVKGKTGEQK